MDENTLPDELTFFLMAVVNAERLSLLGVLAQGPASAAELANKLNLRPAAVMRQLAFLEEAKLVTTSAEDRATYRFNPKQLEKIARQYLSAPRQVFEGADQATNEDERKILAAFVHPDGTLKQIPLQPKKLLPILHYLRSAFEVGVQYTEKEVNEKLSRFHADTPALRRYLVDYKILARERDGATYWLVQN